MSQVDYLRVTHPSATKLYIFHPKTSYIYFVRLACVRHAASVHPEPGSNSQLKFILQLFADFCVVIPYLPYFRFVLFTIRFSLSIFITFCLLFHHIFITSVLTARLLYYFYLPLSILFLKFFKKFLFFYYNIEFLTF